jgi:hypothetical protein
MLLKPNYFRAIGITYVWVFAFAVLSALLNFFRGDPIGLNTLVSFLVIGGAFMSACVCVMFTPRELFYDEQGFAIKTIIQGSATYTWNQLQAYSYWGKGTFLLKFESRQSFQIVPSAFTRIEWQSFITFLRTEFPKKRTVLWFGPIPIRFRK